MMECNAKQGMLKLCVFLEAFFVLFFEWEFGSALKGIKTKFIPFIPWTSGNVL